ncbi:MAG: Cof-type HAD-IIB family hydrolase [Thermoanaerobacteraceae bacterium]|nr:Cof-type HAD-IIB family hydrolase [Thermoanaerobacteraceae bacterium]
MYHMLVTDVDGTLLDKDGKVPEETKLVLKALRERGFITTIATGRMLATAEPVAKEIMINAPLICYNGALIIDIYTRHKILEKYIPAELLIKGIKILKKYNYEIGIYHKDILLIDELNAKTGWYIEANKGIEYHTVGDLEGYVKSTGISSPKIFGIGELGEEATVPAGLVEDLSEDFEVTYAGGGHMEINLKGVNKGSGVKFLAEAFKIDRNDVICIGDGHNDVSMLKYAGMGIAMGNADDRIKVFADYVTVTNKENGLLKIVNEFVVPQEKIVL